MKHIRFRFEGTKVSIVWRTIHGTRRVQPLEMLLNHKVIKEGAVSPRCQQLLRTYSLPKGLNQRSPARRFAVNGLRNIGFEIQAYINLLWQLYPFPELRRQLCLVHTQSVEKILNALAVATLLNYFLFANFLNPALCGFNFRRNWTQAVVLWES